MTPDHIERLPYRRNVGIVLRQGNGTVFAGRRIDSPDQNAWQMPQGGIDDGEDAKTAALREMTEETGVSADLVRQCAVSADWISYDLPIDMIPKLWGGRYRGQLQKWYLFDFLGTDDAININTPEPEFSEWKWMSPKDVIAHIVPFKRATYQNVFAEFDMLA